MDAAPGRPTSGALEAMLQLDHPVKKAATDWANLHLPTTSSLEMGQLIDRDVWRRAAQFGLLGVNVPAAVGGKPLTAVETALTYEGLGASTADNGIVFAVASSAMSVVRAIASSANPAQLDRWFPGLCNGELFSSFAMSEPNAGSNPWKLATVAQPQADGTWVLNGEKTWVTLGPVCDVALVFAVTDPARGQWGISAFIVDAKLPGFERSAPIEKMGLRSCPFGSFTFTDCRLGPDALLGKVGAGAAIFSRIVEAERAFLYAGQVGAIERVIALATHRARTRIQGDVHIGTHQAVSHRLADMKVGHEATRVLLYKAAALADRGQTVSLAAPIVKLMAAQTAISASIDAMRTFGAAGYTTELGIEVELRDALAGLAFSGTPDIARNLIAAQMGLSTAL